MHINAWAKPIAKGIIQLGTVSRYPPGFAYRLVNITTGTKAKGTTVKISIAKIMSLKKAAD
jgi:hypothetical protein